MGDVTGCILVVGQMIPPPSPPLEGRFILGVDNAQLLFVEVPNALTDNS